MKNKTFSILGLSILVLVLFMSAASATITFGTSSALSRTAGNHDYTITITTNTTNSITTSGLGDITDGDKTISFSITAPSSGDDYTIHYSVPIGFEFSDDMSTELTADDGTAKSINLSFENTPIPSGNVYADDGNLDVNIDDLSVENGFGPDDTEWYPLDEIRAKINVDNTGGDKIKSIKVQWGLYDTENEKWIVNGKESSFSLSDGHDTTITVNFQIDKLSKLQEDNTDNYKFYVWATGNDEDTSEKTSVSTSEDVTLDIDDDFVVIDNIQFSSDTVSCGSELQVTADVSNIGNSDEDNVYVIIYNKELGINQKVEIGDINSLDSENLDATINLPNDATEKQYDLIFRVYDEDNDIFENDNSDEAEFFAPITLDSCSTIPPASVSANVLSDVKSGQEFEVKLTITNADTKVNTFNIALSGYSTWASLVNLEKTSVTLNAGESQDVLINLKANDDASGNQNFNVEITEGNKFLSQSVPVTVVKSSFFPSITGLFTSGNNWYLYGIGALNLFLVLIIIVVAVRISRKKE